MSRLPKRTATLRYLAILLLALAALLPAATKVVNVTTSQWFERDLNLRARLAANGVRSSLEVSLGMADKAGTRAILDDLAQDERILAVALVSSDGEIVAASKDYPPTLKGEDLGLDLQSEEATNSRGELGTRAIQISAIPIEMSLGRHHLVLLHDLSFVERRQSLVDRFVWAVFLALLVCGALSLFIGARLSWSEWTNRLRRFVRGESHETIFQPIVTDLRDLHRRVQEERGGSSGPPWTPQRLKQFLRTELMGERLLLLANREPYIHVRGDDGAVRVMHPASGLVTALQPVLRACSGVWIAHGSGNADREVVDAQDRIAVPPDAPEYTLRRVWLTPEQERGYYYGFSNEGLWPLCHLAHVRPEFRKGDWEAYRTVNQLFADTVCAEAGVDDPIVLVQDYHFALAPKMIRERLPRASIITFWHIPWPNAERVGICPWAAEILDGMLGSSILGFHTQLHCNNFLDSVDRFLESRIDREVSGVQLQGRISLVRPYPISIEWPLRWPPEAPLPARCREAVLRELELPNDAILGVGVDRLDYTKGIIERFRCIEAAIESNPSLAGRLCFAQLSAPSRSAIESYQAFEREVTAEAERINRRFATAGWPTIRLMRAHHEFPRVMTFYRAADFCMVTSLHDGMNLVAKEFVAARDDEQGVLILSQFTGASKELSAALIVNPYDVHRSAEAVALAISMSADEQRTRMRALRAVVEESNVYSWAGRMLMDAAKLRWHERLAGRLKTFPEVRRASD